MRANMHTLCDVYRNDGYDHANLTLDEVRVAMDDPNTVIVDLRDVRELWRDGKIPGALHSPRGMNEF